MGQFGQRPAKKMRLDAPRLRFETLEDRRVMSAAALTSDELAPVEAAAQTSAAILSEPEWVRSLTYQQFNLLTPLQVPYLTTQQVASIPTIGWFSTMAPASRAALNVPQVQALNIAEVRADLLTAQQIAWLTPAQIQSLDRYQFKYLSASQIPYLTPGQVASIPDPAALTAMSPAARAALTVPQVQALNVGPVRINLLTPQQVSWLTVSQIRSLGYYDFEYLSAAQATSLTPAQIGSIPDLFAFSQWSSAARAALTVPQVQALNVGSVRIDLLTAQQVSWLRPLQIQALDFYQFKYLSPAQATYLTPAQIASIPDPAPLTAMSAAARAALTPAQVQALRVGAVRINLLTSQQVTWLLPSQIQTLKYYDFAYLSAAQTPYLTFAQIASIPDQFAFSQWSPVARAALTSAQIPALNVARTMIDLLTPRQVGWLTTAQIQALDIYQFKFLNPAQIPLLTTAQIATIPDPGPIGLWSAAARAALTPAQVQALNVLGVGLELLPAQQVGYLSISQIQQLGFYQFKFLHPNQIPWLTSAQIASIPDPGPFGQWTSAARAALTPPQVQALNVDVRIDLLTSQQAGWLSVTQLRQLDYFQFKYLSPNQIPALTTAQIASIPNPASFVEWSADARAALTVPQIQALNVAGVRIDLLTPQQIAWLTAAQIAVLSIYDIPYLNPAQIPFLSPAQFAAMLDTTIILGLSDRHQARFTRQQLLNLPFDVLSQYMRAEPSQFPPEHYHPTIATPLDANGIQISDHINQEAQLVFDLVPYSAVTHMAVQSGNWSDPRTWFGGVAPTAGANVLIAPGTNVLFDSFMTTTVRTLRIDGTLRFATTINTQLMADTIVVYTTGALNIGTAADPVHNNVTARVVIADGGSIDTRWDPHLFSRGILSRGDVRMFGASVTPYLALAADPMAGATTLQLSQVPVGWTVGDDLVVAGTNQYAADFGTEIVKIRAINGSIVTVDPLRYSHDAPDGRGLSIHVSNLKRNIQLVAADASVPQERPHLMFFHNPDVVIENIGVYGFGRTDKTRPINSPVVVNGVMQPGTGTNARARYAMHFHHTGVNPNVAPAVVRGSVVAGSPGWGFVNHSSHVIFENNVAYNVVGASFSAEDGNEIGVMRGNLAMNSTGSKDFILARRENHDFGHGGHGFWFQGPGIEVVDNISTGNGGGAFAYVTSSSKNHFDAVNLNDPSLAAGRISVPVGAVPLSRFEGNTAYASKTGLEVWFHQTMLNDGETLIQDFTSWNTRNFGIELPYSGRVTIRDAKLIGDLKAFAGIGVFTNRLTHDVVLDNVRAEGFHIGVTVPVRRSTLINGGYFSNVQNLFIEKGYDTIRSVYIIAPVFQPLTATQLRGRKPYNIFASGRFDFNKFLDRRVDSLFSADEILYKPVLGAAMRLQYFEQYQYYTPFPSSSSTGKVPDGYLDKTNVQLSQTYGTSYGGGIAPTTVILSGIFGFAVPAA